MLLDVRVALHRTTGKGSDRLVLQQQLGVAEELGLPDVDTMMRFLSGAARTIAWASDDKWHRVESHLKGPSGRVAKRDRVMSEGVVLRDGEIVAAADAPMHDPSLSVRVASAAAQTRVPIARATLERLRAEAAAPGEPWPPAAREALAELFGAGSACIGPFEALDQYGLVMRLLPEWAAVRSRVQHNPYHRYTVDRHLLEAAVQAAALTDRVARPDLLLFGAWLHDLGKGYPGDHTEAGVALMTRIAPRMGFPPADIDVLIRLVRDHLLLADAATRRDIRDPATPAHVAAAVGDVATLELLAALTEADSKATGETAWSNWKATLLAELVQRVADVLEGAQPAPKARDLEPHLQALVEKAQGRVLITGEDDRVVVVAPDRPGLFCQLAGVLALHGLDVLAADVQSSDLATAVDEFRVSATHGGPPPWERFGESVVKVLDGRLALEARLAERARTYNTRLGGDDTTSHGTQRHTAQRRKRRRVGDRGARAERGGCALPDHACVLRPAARHPARQGADARRRGGRQLLRRRPARVRSSSTSPASPSSAGRSCSSSRESTVDRQPTARCRSNARDTSSCSSCGGEGLACANGPRPHVFPNVVPLSIHRSNGVR